MRARVLAVTTAAVLSMTLTLSGCITVHGEKVVVPAVSKAEAAKVLKAFTETNNEANRTLDAKLNTTIEAGPLGAIDQAGLKARKTVHKGTNPDHEPLEFSDTRYLIPQQAGWPKFFVADSSTNRGDTRWLLVFSRGSIDAEWKATYLAVLTADQLPEFTEDKKGHVQAVKSDDSALAIAPKRLSTAYTTYLRDGKGSVFAPGGQTSELREQREKNARTPTVWNDYIDRPADKGTFAPLGLRTEDGGALVFFSSYHYHKQTAAEGLKPPLKDAYVQALTTGVAEHAITYTYVSEQAVSVPGKDAGGGQVAFLSRIAGLTEAKAE